MRPSASACIRTQTALGQLSNDSNVFGRFLEVSEQITNGFGRFCMLFERGWKTPTDRDFTFELSLSLPLTVHFNSKIHISP